MRTTGLTSTSTPTLAPAQAPAQAPARGAKARRRTARTVRAAEIAGGVLSLAALALSSAQFYQVSAAKFGPGAFLLTIPKHIGAGLAPLVGAAGAAGAACSLAALRLERDEKPARRRLSFAAAGLGAGLAAVGLSAAYMQAAAAAHGDFAAAFGADWQERIPPQLRRGLLPRRWTLNLRPASGVRVERNVVFAAAADTGASAGPGTGRKLLADVWSPPADVAPSGLGLIYLHGGGYSAFDKGGPTELWFRRLAGQGHVVMDVAYRLIPEATVPQMQGDVKRAVVWLKRNAGRYGVDPRAIVLSGGSAGSHLALLAAYAPCHPLFTPEDLAGEDLSVRGVVAFYNAGDYRQESRPDARKTPWQQTVTRLLTAALEGMSGAKVPVEESGDWDPKLFLGPAKSHTAADAAAEWAELYRQISPITHVGPHTSKLPATLQIVGAHDVYGAAAPVAALHTALVAAGAPAVVLQIPRTDHAFDLFFPQYSPAAQTAMYDVDRFLALLAGTDV